VKRVVPIFAVLFLFITCMVAVADVPVFGNSTNSTSGFQVGIAGDNTFGAAIGFTPLENLSVTSVTLWLSGYNGLSTYYSGPAGIVFTNQSYIIGISGNGTSSGFNHPGIELSPLNVPAPNDGSLAPFTFTVPSGTLDLEANQEYWVFIYGITMPESFLYYNSSDWVGGGTPTGDAIYDGALSSFSADYTPSSDIPAFTINVAPEPSEYALIGLGAVVLGVYSRKSLKSTRLRHGLPPSPFGLWRTSRRGKRSSV